MDFLTDELMFIKQRKQLESITIRSLSIIFANEEWAVAMQKSSLHYQKDLRDNTT